MGKVGGRTYIGPHKLSLRDQERTLLYSETKRAPLPDYQNQHHKNKNIGFIPYNLLPNFDFFLNSKLYFLWTCVEYLLLPCNKEIKTYFIIYLNKCLNLTDLHVTLRFPSKSEGSKLNRFMDSTKSRRSG